MKKVFAVHTAIALVEPITQLFKEYYPDVQLNHIADDSLIQEVIRNNKVTAAVRKRLYNYYFSAVDAGADIIFNTCSSIGNEAIMARDFLTVPLVKIDDAMAKQAVNQYMKIGIIATLPTTLEPTAQLVERFSAEHSKPIILEKALAEGAFQALMEGNSETHDKIILKTAAYIKDKVDVLLLAQGSMARMEQELHNATGKPVLSSPLSGVLSLKEWL